MKRSFLLLACWAACTAPASANVFLPPPPYSGPPSQWGGWAWTSLSNDGTREGSFAGNGSTLDFVADFQRTSRAEGRDGFGRTGQGAATGQVRSTVSATRVGVETQLDGSASADAGYGWFSHGGPVEGYAWVNVPFMVTAPSLALGASGHMVVPLFVTGSATINGSGFIAGSEVGYGSASYSLQLGTSGRVQRNPACNTHWDFCWYRGINTGTGETGARPPAMFMVEFDFRAGQWSAYSLEMIMRGDGMANAWGSSHGGGGAQTFVSAGFDLIWGGVAGVFDAQGNPVANWSIQSLTGVDLSVSAVPEPGTWALMLLGAAGIAARVRRARPASPSGV